MNWPPFALSAFLFVLCGCAASPVRECPKPLPAPPEFLSPLPEPGWFRQELERILEQGLISPANSTPLPTVPTPFSHSAVALSNSSPADIF